MTRTPLTLGPLTALLVLLAAGPAAAQDANPTDSSASGFPIALVVRARNQKRNDR